jgi:hypothetical protein
MKSMMSRAVQAEPLSQATAPDVAARRLLKGRFTQSSITSQTISPECP